MLMIKIDNNIYKWNSNEYTDYELQKDYFIVKKHEQWVGAYLIVYVHNFCFEVHEDK